MNKVVTINLNGNAFQLEEAGYDALRAYLEAAASQLSGNPDKDEILADIEQAIADKCRGVLTAYRNVVSTADLKRIIGEMGPVDSGSAPGAGGPSTPPPAADRSQEDPRPGAAPAGEPVRRLYRLYEGAMISGVCNGLGAYFHLDPTLVRVVFVLLAILTLGGAALVYLALVVAIPSAQTPAEAAAARGEPNTAQEFIRRARQGYYDSLRSLGDKENHREWRRRFRREMRGWRHAFQHEAAASRNAWQQHWQLHPGAYHGMWFTVSLLSLVRSALTVLWIFAMISLLAKGTLFGLALPAGMPVWVAVLILFVAYQLVIWPLRATRNALCHHGWGGGPYPTPFFGLLDAVVWVACVALFIWLADRYVPGAHDALVNLPATLQHAADGVREWWTHR